MGKEAQTKLAELEKADAPIAEQLEQAGEFAGVEWLDFLQTAIPSQDTARSGNFHGREEWVLRWLLKKLGSAQARRCPQSWRLLRCLVQRVPLPTVARCLNERKGMEMLRAAVEEAVTRQKEDREPKIDKSSSSRKRKRDGDLVAEGNVEAETYDIAEVIYEVLELIVGLATPEDRPDTDAFAAEYMKSVTRVVPEESAKLLGSWLELCRLNASNGDESQLTPWLTPFVETWKARMDGADDSLLFSKYCLQPLLSLLSSTELPSKWKTQLEQLLSRNITLPARNAFSDSKTTDVLASLVTDAVTKRPDFAPVLFENAIRSLQPNNTHRGRTQDNSWLQIVFRILTDACPVNPWKVKNEAVNKMLKMCLEHEVKPDLAILWSVTSECGLHSEGTDEEIIATLISLDGHIFTLPSTEERDILKELFSRITTLSATTEWPVVADTYVDRILVPMMDHFAKARDLTGFIRHWYEQLVAFDALLSERKPKDELPHLGAWEDDALLKKLKGIMEASLTSEQIVSLLDWVQEQTGNPGPALVVMDAITGAIITEETIESAKLYLWALPWTVAQKSVSERYKRRQSRIITHMIDTCTLEYYDKLWTAHPDISKQFISIGGALTEPTTLAEIFKSAASQYTLVSMLNSDLLSEELITPLKKMLRKKFLGEAIHWFQSSGKDAVKEHRRTSIDVNLKTQDLVYSLAKTILVDYPKFVKVFSSPSKKEEPILEILLWFASTTTPHSAEHSPNTWIRHNHNALPELWRTMLRNEDVLNDEELIGTIIDILLKCGTHENNPIEKWTSCNGFAIECLNSLPIAVFSRSARERVLRAWPPVAPEPSLNDTRTLAYRMSNLDAAVISLKMKMMERPTIYEGFTHRDLVTLAQAISELSPDPKAPLDAFAVYAERALGHVGHTVGQIKSDTFIRDMSTELSLRGTDESSKSTLSCGRIQLAEIFVSFLTSFESRVLKVDGITSETILETKTAFRDELIANMKRLLKKPAKLKKETDERSMSLYSTIRALEDPVFSIENGSLSHLYEDAMSCLKEIKARNAALASHIKRLFVSHIPTTTEVQQYDMLDEDVTTSFGRIAIMKTIQAQTTTMNELQKRALLLELISDSAQNLEKLLAVRYVLEACEDKQPRDETEENLPPLSAAYTALTASLASPLSLPHLSLVTSILSHTLRTKPRSFTQHAVESILSAIPTLLSRTRISPAKTHSHLTSLLATLLSSHRLSLTSRAPLLNLALLALLTPLFSPDLGLKHAEAYSRLLTTLADPAATAVRSSTSTPLVSATAKAKRQAGSHLPIIIGAYVKHSLDPSSRMKLEVREELKRGIWAIFAAMGSDGRKVLGEEMDRSGRDVLRNLVGEWVRFGKWKGN